MLRAFLPIPGTPEGSGSRAPAGLRPHPRTWLALAAIAGLATLLACSDPGPGGESDGDGPFEMESVEFAPALEVDIADMERRDSGLYVQDLAPGDGAEATPGNRVSVHYTGWLPDGTQFDTSRDMGQPFQFTLGAGQVIPGWDEGVAGMREGGIRRLVIPPELAYGSQGAGGVIPPNTPLVFEVELLEVIEAG